MTATDPTPATLPHRRLIPLLIVFALAAALVGYLRGIQPPPPVSRPHAADPQPHGSAPPARSYAELMRERQVPAEAVGVFDPVVRTEEMKQAALADRARNRAFDTAPPTIPHPTDGMTAAAACLACHGTGLRLGDRVATRISHPHFTNCAQCHAPAAPPELAAFATTGPDNGFVGAYRPGPGSRAAPAAPPVIPHTTWMRQDCTSCHGLAARPGVRTTHPWLTNCAQCHAPSAALDQVAFPLPANGDPP